MSNLRNLNPSHVVLLTVDCLRADTARELNTISDLTISYIDVPDCQCTGSGTPTSMPGIMQSRLPTDYGGKAKAHPLVTDVPTLAETFKNAGYSCGGWHSNTYTSREFEYQRGFDVFADLKSDSPKQRINKDTREDSTSRPSFKNIGKEFSKRLGMETQARRIYDLLRKVGITEGLPYARAESVVNAIVDWLPQESSTESYFAWGHFMDLHSPYVPPKNHKETNSGYPESSKEIWELNQVLQNSPQHLSGEQIQKIRGMYNASGHYVDDQIHRLITALQDRDLWNDTLLVITSDHGEMFNDRPIPDDFAFQHPNYLCDYVTHVPLVFAGGSLPDLTIGGTASGADVAPTIASIMDIDIPLEWRGKVIGTSAYQERNLVYSVTGRGTRQDQTERMEIPSDTFHVSLRTPNDAVLWWSDNVKEPELYDRSKTHSDPAVHENQIDEMEMSEDYIEKITNKFSTKASQYSSSKGESAENLDEKAIERLRRLGYIN